MCKEKIHGPVYGPDRKDLIKSVYGVAPYPATWQPKAVVFNVADKYYGVLFQVKKTGLYLLAAARCYHGIAPAAAKEIIAAIKK